MGYTRIFVSMLLGFPAGSDAAALPAWLPERAVCAPVGGRVDAPPTAADARADCAPVRPDAAAAVCGRGVPAPLRGVPAPDGGRDPRALAAPPAEGAGGGSPPPVRLATSLVVGGKNRW